ncbi:MAG: hypothetical protein HXY37_15525 [Chloroflexi bacterium]|nr:hypothetical protein [Chloroflexota bacterium]
MNTAGDTLLDRRRIEMPRRIHARSAGLCIHSFETALDLVNLTMTSIPITAAALAEASGLTVAEITQPDEPRYQRTRGHS